MLYVGAHVVRGCGDLPIEIPMLHVSVAYISPCHMSNVRRAHVTCHYVFDPMSHVTKSTTHVVI